jgi:hypothetical protein
VVAAALPVALALPPALALLLALLVALPELPQERATHRGAGSVG